MSSDFAAGVFADSDLCQLVNQCDRVAHVRLGSVLGVRSAVSAVHI